MKNIENERLINEFGAGRISDLEICPDFYTFNNNLIFSHRNFDEFMSALEKGEKVAIVSGVNASGKLHLGHKAVFDTNLFFQKKYGVPIFIPISDDESYVSGKMDSQEEALKNALELAREMLAFGFDPNNTYIVIDQIYTPIYNFSIKLSKRITLSEIRSTYGYTNGNNIGLFYYPSIQSAHILFPFWSKGIENILVPIGPDEDAHMRICRDLARKFKIKKPATIHSVFLPGIDGKKMSKSKGNAIYLNDSPKEIKKKISRAFSGGQQTIEEHRRLGGNPEIDVAFIYLRGFFLSQDESNKLAQDYKAGKILSGELKQMLIKHVLEFVETFQKRKGVVSKEDLQKCILNPDSFSLKDFRGLDLLD